MIRISVSLILAAILGVSGQEKKDGHTAFALELHKVLKPAEENQFFSPISITAALGMTEAGARKVTAEQMRKVLHLADDEKRHERLGKLIRDLSGKTRDANGYELAIANRLWPHKDLALEKAFLDITKTHYAAPTESLDYVADTEAARTTINQWVEKQTKEKIKDLLAPGILNTATRLVLTNAIYFKGDWLTQFDKTKTRDAEFFTGAETSVKVPMMHRTGKIAYGETADAQIVELPFKGKEISMVVILPRDRTGIAKLEAGLTVDSLQALLAGAKEDENVKLALPRFKMESSFSLNDILSNLGMPLAFSQGADFSGMTGDTSLFISAVIHKAFVDVNEEGAEAAAATAVVAERKLAPQMMEFKADHPFLFAIRDMKTGTLLFMGRLAKP